MILSRLFPSGIALTIFAVIVATVSDVDAVRETLQTITSY